MISKATTSLRDELLSFIATDVVLHRAPVALDTDLVMSGQVDSLGVMAIVEWIERRLGIEIDPGDVVIEHFGTVASMIDYLRGRDDGMVA